MSAFVGREMSLDDSGEHALVLDVLPEVVIERFVRTDGGLTRENTYKGRTFSQRAQPQGDHPNDYAAWWDAFLADRVTRPGDGRIISAVDVFSGSGGFSLGLRSAVESLGGRLSIRAAIDIDESALQVHKHNHGTEHLISQSADLLVDAQVRGSRTSSKFKYEPEIVHDELALLSGQVDVLIGGPPCQGHSSLNNATRHNDERNSLYLTMPALAVALDAPVVIIENVPGVVRDVSGVVQTSETLLQNHGYHVTSGVLAAHQLGWAQTRKRFFLIGVKDQFPIPLRLQEAALRREGLTLRWALSSIRSSGGDPMMDGLPVFSPENMERMAYLAANQEDQNLPLAIRPLSHRNGTSYMSVYGRMDWDQPAPTLTTGFATPGRGRFTHPDQTRTLTAREAARLQGFPNSYFSPEIMSIMRPTRGQLTKWIGDAVPAPLGYPALLAALAPYMVSP
jgi:DNA (cytosine-5)-methyltransferase 1